MYGPIQAVANRAETNNGLQVLFTLRRIGRPIYGFDPDTYVPPQKRVRGVMEEGDA